MFKSLALPPDQDPITVSWVRPDLGGLCIGAYTEKSGEPNITFMKLDRQGQTVGSPFWLEKPSFESKVTIGFIDEQPVKIYVEANLNCRGLEMKLILPWEGTPAYGYHRRFFQLWDHRQTYAGMFMEDETANYILNKSA